MVRDLLAHRDRLAGLDAPLAQRVVGENGGLHMRRRRSRPTESQIMDAAEELLCERKTGVEVSLADIAARANVSLGSIFNNFGSRAGLDSALAALRVLQRDSLWADLDEVLASDSGLGRVRAAAEAHLRLHIDDPDVAPVFTRDTQLPDTPVPAARPTRSRQGSPSKTGTSRARSSPRSMRAPSGQSTLARQPRCCGPPGMACSL